MRSASPVVLDELIDCIANGRDPTTNELLAVAERVWTDGQPERSAFAWQRLPVDGSERLHALRAAQLALSGEDPATMIRGARGPETGSRRLMGCR